MVFLSRLTGLTIINLVKILFKKFTYYLAMKILFISLIFYQISMAIYAEVKIGNILALTGPVSLISKNMGEAIDLAIEHINDQGALFLDNQKLVILREDSKCDPIESVKVAKNLVEVEKVSGIIGPVCSIPAISQAEQVSIPAGVVTISMSASSPKLSSFEFNSDLVFRTISSFSVQGEILAQVAKIKKIEKVAIYFENKKPNENILNSFIKKFESYGGEILKVLPFEKGEDTYHNQISELEEISKNLILISNDINSTIRILSDININDKFNIVLGNEGILTPDLVNEIEIEKVKKLTVVSSAYDTSSLAFKEWEKYANTAGLESNASFLPNAYDAAFLIGLAIEKAGSTDLEKIAKSLREVANSPGEKILPGQWEKAKALISSGESIDYIGASGKIEFDENGDLIGNYSINIITENKWKSVVIDQ